MLWYFCGPLQTGHALVCGENNYSTGPLIVRLLGSNLHRTGTSVEYRLLQQRSTSFVHVNEYRHTTSGLPVYKLLLRKGEDVATLPSGWKTNSNNTIFEHMVHSIDRIEREYAKIWAYNLFDRSFFYGRWSRGGRVQLLVSQPSPSFGKMFCRPCFIFHSLKAETRVFPPSLNLVFYCLSFY